MTEALVIMHVESEGPGTLGAFLAENGAGLTYARLYAGEGLPERDFDLIVSMGGAMNAFEDDKHPFLAREAPYLRERIEAGAHVLGVCLGAQMIARAMGARVYKNPAKEIGWFEINLTEEGKKDAVFEGLPGTLEVFQWHEDTFDLPDGGRLLASAPGCENQAFRVNNALGFQFHVEVDRAILDDWFDGSSDKIGIIERYDELERDYSDKAGRIYRNLLALL